MSEYTLYDFTESLGQVDLGEAKLTHVIKSWGHSPEGYGSWEGGFVLKLSDGRYAYLTGWCTTTGWGGRDGAEIQYAASLEELTLPTESSPKSGEPRSIEWDEYPADLNRWIQRDCPNPFEV